MSFSSATSTPPMQARSSYGGVLLVAVISALLCAPFVTSVFSLGDEGKLLHGAERMLRGYRLYVDFFEFLPPGGFVLTAAWLRAAGASIWSVRLLAISTIVGIACFTYLACRRTSKSAPLSAVLAVGWIVMSQGGWTQINHHYFTALLSIVTAWAALNNIHDASRGRRWSLIAGISAGAAVTVTSSCGALAALAGLVGFANRRRNWVGILTYCSGVAVAPAGMLAYLAWHHALIPAFNDAILFPATRYALMGTIPFGTFADGQSFPLLFLFPLLALVTFFLCVRDWRACIYDYPLWIAAAFAVAAFLGCFPRPDIVHIAFAAPLVLPLLARCLAELSRGWYPAFRYAAAGILIGLCAPTLFSFSSVVQESLNGRIVSTPRGEVTVVNQPGAAELILKLAELSPQDDYFFYPYMPMLPFITARRHVSKYDEFVPEVTSPAQYRDACASVMRHATWVIIDRGRTDPEFLKLIHPAIQDAQPAETRAFEKNLSDGFELVAREGRFELRRRRGEGVNESACADIAG